MDDLARWHAAHRKAVSDVLEHARHAPQLVFNKKKNLAQALTYAQKI
jgi:hypothetical protein